MTDRVRKRLFGFLAGPPAPHYGGRRPRPGGDQDFRRAIQDSTSALLRGTEQLLLRLHQAIGSPGPDDIPLISPELIKP